MNVPYNTGKVRIGLAWQPPQRAELGADEMLVQRALLGHPDEGGGLWVTVLAAVAAVAAALFLGAS